MDNQHKMIPGFRDLNESEIVAIQTIKHRERDIATFFNEFLDSAPVELDHREMALAKTHFEDAFIHFVKAVARPDSPWSNVDR